MRTDAAILQLIKIMQNARTQGLPSTYHPVTPKSIWLVKQHRPQAWMAPSMCVLWKLLLPFDKYDSTWLCFFFSLGEEYNLPKQERRVLSCVSGGYLPSITVCSEDCTPIEILTIIQGQFRCTCKGRQSPRGLVPSEHPTLYNFVVCALMVFSPLY